MAYTSPTVPASGTTFAEFQAAGPAGHLQRIVAELLAGTANPTAPTLSAAGGGSANGLLPTGTVYVVVTETNGIGETLASTEVSAAITTGDIPTVTFAALQTGNTARNVYVGMASGAEVLYATGVTAATLNLAAAIPANSFAVAPPKVNSTALSYATSAAAGAPVENAALQYLMAPSRDVVAMVRPWQDAVALISSFNRGEPIPINALVSKLRHAHTFFAAVAQLFAEMGTLIDANPGTLGVVTNGIGEARIRRTWP